MFSDKLDENHSNNQSAEMTLILSYKVATFVYRDMFRVIFGLLYY